MRKLILIAHISLDGFVALENGSLDGFDASDENLGFVCKLTEDADTALFGRVSYQLLNNFWPMAKGRPGATQNEINYSNWYNAATKIVISKTLVAPLHNTIILNENFANEISKIKRQAGKDILIFGSTAISQVLIELDLIDSYWIFVNPAIFGKGVSLFKNMNHNINLKLVDVKRFANDELALHYLPIQNSNERYIE